MSGTPIVSTDIADERISKHNCCNEHDDLRKTSQSVCQSVDDLGMVLEELQEVHTVSRGLQLLTFYDVMRCLLNIRRTYHRLRLWSGVFDGR